MKPEANLEYVSDEGAAEVVQQVAVAVRLRVLHLTKIFLSSNQSFSILCYFLSIQARFRRRQITGSLQNLGLHDVPYRALEALRP